MNVYIGKRESRIAIVAPPREVLKPAPATVAETVMNKPPNSHTPAINAKIICEAAIVLFVRLARKKITKSVTGDITVTILHPAH